MAATLSRELGIDAALVEGSRGIFDVAADGTLIFSKDASGRFPEDAEIVEAFKARQRP